MVSSLIQALEEILEVYGDLEVFKALNDEDANLIENIVVMAQGDEHVVILGGEGEL